MNIDLILIGKLFLILYLWVLIAITALFILNSNKIYQKLKKYELICRDKRKEVVHNFAPITAGLRRYNKNFQMLTGIKKSTIKDFLLSATSFIFNTSGFLLGVKSSSSLIKKLLLR